MFHITVLRVYKKILVWRLHEGSILECGIGNVENLQKRYKNKPQTDHC